MYKTMLCFEYYNSKEIVRLQLENRDNMKYLENNQIPIKM